MTKLNMNTNASYNFVAPEIAADADKKIEVIFPTQEAITVVGDGNKSVSIQRAFTHITMDVETNLTLTGVVNVNNLKIGDKIVISATAKDDDRVLTLHTSLGNRAINLTQDAEENILLVWNGTTFKVLAFGDGADGSDGDDGADGSSFLSGAGVPDNQFGADGDLYLNTTDGEVYKKVAGTWGSIGNLKGADGNDGNDGAPGASMTFEKVTPAFAAAIELQITEGKTLAVPGTLTDDLALTADVTAAIDGAMVYLVATPDANQRTITLGAGFTGGAIVLTASETKRAAFIFNGTALERIY